MIMSEKQTAAVERKQRICDRYKGADTAEVEVIPAKPTEALEGKNTILRVAAYVRVSTDNDEQLTSYELQKNYYTDYISSHPGWVLAGIYADEGISGTSLEHRKGMQQMIEDCRGGKIDLILTKSIARFARNIVDCLSVIETLKNLEPPVGVQFEADNIYTLDIQTYPAKNQPECPFVNDVRPKKRKKRTLEYLTQGGACPELRQIFWSRESSRWRAFGDFQPRTDMGMSLLRRRYLFI